MTTIYCQNMRCPYYEDIEEHKLKEYGKCIRKVAYMPLLTDAGYKVTGYNCSCLMSQQKRQTT